MMRVRKNSWQSSFNNSVRSTKAFFIEMQAMGQLVSLLASSHVSSRIVGKAKALVLAIVKSQGDDRIIVQSSKFSKAA